MGCNKIGPTKKTANFARTVYFFASLLLFGVSSASEAQMLDLGELQNWRYSGVSVESHKGRSCSFSPGPLKRDSLTRRFLQDYTFNFEARAADQALSLGFLQRANIRLMSPATCSAQNKQCEFEMLVEALSPSSNAAERYLLVLTSKETAPTDLSKAELYLYGESTGRKRLSLECSQLKRSEVRR